MRFAVRIDVTHLPGVLDPAGATVERALPALGYDNVSQLSIAKTIRLELDAESHEAADTQVHEMCERLLANPVIEQYTVEIVAGAEVPALRSGTEPALRSGTEPALRSGTEPA